MKTNLKTYLLILSLFISSVYAANAAMSLSFTWTDMTYCGSLGSATVTVTGNNGPLHYQWYDVNSFPVGTNSPVLANVVAGHYTVVVADLVGFVSGSVDIGFFDGFTPEIFGPGSDCNHLPYQYTVTNPGDFPPSTVFQWYLNNNPAGVGTSVILSPVASNTIYVVASDNGCSTPSTAITIQKCCNHPGVPANDMTLSAFMTAYNGGGNIYDGQILNPDIVINGNFIWDMDATFKNCNFYCGPGSRILNNTGKTMSFETCTWQAGCGIMWQGIEITKANPGLTLSMTLGCVMQDAYYGIWQRKPLDMLLDKVIFDNNYIGVKYGFYGYVQNTGFLIVSVQPGTYNHVQFHATKPLIPAYPGLLADPTVPGYKGYAGIYADHVYNLEFYNDVTFGGNPIFDPKDHLNIGIACFNSGLNIHPFNAGGTFFGVYFQNILQENFYGSGAPNGCAIYANGDPREVSGKLTVTGLINTPLANNVSFNNCTRGVYSLYMVDNNISDNIMTKIRNQAVYIGNAFDVLNVTGNIIDAGRRGIELAFCAYFTAPPVAGTYAQVIEDNVINIGFDPAYNSSVAQGIYVHEAIGNTDASDALISHNTLQIEIGSDGIHLQNLVNTFNPDNNMVLDYPGTSYGYRLANCNNITTQCGSVASPVSVFNPTINHWGYYVWQSPLNTVECLYTNYMWRNFDFRGDCFPTYWRANWLDNASDAGYFLSGTAITGQQILNGNKWSEPSTTFPLNRAGVCNNLSSGSNLVSAVYVDPTNFQEPGGYWWYPNFNNLGNPGNTTPGQGFWFRDTLGPTRECGSLCWVIRPGDESSDLDALVATNSTLTSEFIPESKKVMQQKLFERLRSNSDLLNSSSVYQQFYASKLGTNAETFAQVKEDIKTVSATESLLAQQRNDIYTQLNDLQQTLSTNNAALNSATISTNDRLNLLAANTSIHDQMESLFLILRPLNAQIQAGREAAADGVYSSVENITGNDVIESNSKIVYEIYTQTVGRGIMTLNGDQAEALRNIAIQCPDAGGPAVIEARSMYDLADQDIVYDDNSNCLEFGSARSGATQKTAADFYASVKPNPAIDRMTINYNINDNAEFTLTSITGQTVYSTFIYPDKKQAEINIKGITPGVYTWKIMSGTNMKFGKLIIIK